MWPKNVPASERRRASALSAAASSGPIRPAVVRRSAPRSISARKYGLAVGASTYPWLRWCSTSKPDGRCQGRQAAGQPAVVHQELDGRVDAGLQGVAVVEGAGRRRVVAVERREHPAGP